MRVVVEGLIGVGKSTFTTEASSILGLKPLYESVDDNPFLEKYYQDPYRWGYTLQMHFLYDRLSKHMEKAMILDRSIWGDLCFANILLENGILTEEEHSSYLRHSEMARGFIPHVDYCIHLHIGVEEAQKRIAKRGRDFESGITADYLHKLQDQLDQLPSWLPKSTQYIRVDWEDMTLPEIRERIESLPI